MNDRIDPTRFFDNMKFYSDTSTQFSLLPTKTTLGIDRVKEVLRGSYRRAHGVTITRHLIGAKSVENLACVRKVRMLEKGKEIAYLDGSQDAIDGLMRGFYSVCGEVTGRDHDGTLHNVIFAYRSSVIFDTTPGGKIVGSFGPLTHIRNKYK